MPPNRPGDYNVRGKPSSGLKKVKAAKVKKPKSAKVKPVHKPRKGK